MLVLDMTEGTPYEFADDGTLREDEAQTSLQDPEPGLQTVVPATDHPRPSVAVMALDIEAFLNRQ